MNTLMLNCSLMQGTRMHAQLKTWFTTFKNVMRFSQNPFQYLHFFCNLRDAFHSQLVLRLHGLEGSGRNMDLC